MRSVLSLSLLLATPAFADEPAAAPAGEPMAAEAPASVPEGAAASATVESDGYWNAARDTWSKEAIVNTFKKVKEAPAPSSFLGETADMKKYSRVEWAWFAEGFSPDTYKTVAVAPATNGMGRYKVTGEKLVQTMQIQYLQGVTKAWKKKVTAGTEGDLVVYTNLHWFSTTANGVEYVVESMGVAGGNIVFKLQYLAGTNGTTGMVAGALSGGVSGMVNSIPDDKDQFAYYATTATEVGGLLRTALVDAANGIKKGKDLPPMGPAIAFGGQTATLLPAQKESFGPALNAQIDGWLAIVKDTNAEDKERADRLRDLGKIGATAAIPYSEELIRDPKAKNRIQENAAWALGEIGHPDAMDTLSSAKGVDGFAVKAAITKITVY